MTRLMKRILKKTAQPQKGFTLLEMVIVLSIIALLMLIVIPNLNTQRQNAVKRSDQALTRVIENQAETYQEDHVSSKDEAKVALTADTEKNLDALEHAEYITAGQHKQATDHKLEIKWPIKASSAA